MTDDAAHSSVDTSHTLMCIAVVLFQSYHNMVA